LQQNAGSVTPPASFTNYLGVTSLAATSVSGTDYYAIEQKIEGFNTADLSFGTANAQTITLSFWVRSSLTGTFGGNIRNETSNYCYPFSYTISSANTWEKKTVTIAGATAGTWVGATNAAGMTVAFNLGVGSTYTGTANAWYASTIINPTGATSVVGTNGATWYLTGVQLEQNTSATPFERRLYGQELANCQRYYQNVKGAIGIAATTSSINWTAPLLVQMRASPSIGKTSTTFAWGDMVSTGYSSSGTATLSYDANASSLSGALDGFTALVAYRSYRHEPTGANNALFALSAEL
jgi:hypothetical protein